MDANDLRTTAPPTSLMSASEKGGADRSLADNAYERILSMIVDGTLSVGDKLPTEAVLSETFEMSRPVLRQALRQLREDGLIVSRQGSGSYVKRRPDMAMLDFAAIGSIADIQRTFEFRTALEGEAAYLAAKRRTSSDLDEMQKILALLDQHVREGLLGVDLDEAFHAIISAASDNAYFAAVRQSMKQNIVSGMNLTRNLSLARPQERALLVQAEHYAIFDAIKAQDAGAARDAMRAHIDNARVRVFEGID